VNLSPSSLLSQEVLRALPHRLDDLVIEITEHELLSDDPAIGEAIADLRGRGARLAVDDTGAGYAGLTHVIRLQPDIIKLDRALTTGVDSDPVKAALIGSFVRYARDIDATVCAEGVETVHELERLADLDVAYGQGYAIARPSAPWAEVAPEASSTCVASFRATLAEAGDDGSGESDRRLEALARRLADAVSADDLTGCLPSVARQLGADEVRLVAAPDGEHVAVHTLAGDPATPRHDVRELRELGYGSRLSLPIVHRGAARFRLEAFATARAAVDALRDRPCPTHLPPARSGARAGGRRLRRRPALAANRAHTELQHRRAILRRCSSRHSSVTLRSAVSSWASRRDCRCRGRPR
jgi:hypothetical protein